MSKKQSQYELESFDVGARATYRKKDEGLNGWHIAFIIFIILMIIGALNDDKSDNYYINNEPASVSKTISDTNAKSVPK